MSSAGAKASSQAHGVSPVAPPPPATLTDHALRPADPAAEAPAANPMRRLGILVGIAIVAGLLWWMQAILLPFAIAVLLSFLLSPLSDWLEHRRVPRTISVVLVVTLAFLVLAALGWAVFNGVQQLGNNVDRIAGNLEQKLTQLPFRKEIQEIGSKLERAEQAAGAVTGEPDSDAQPIGTSTRGATRQAAAPGQDVAPPLPVTVVARETGPLERVGQLLGFIAGPLGAAGLILIFTIFILLQRDDLRDRVITLAAGPRLNLATQALDDATSRISRYLRAQALVNGTYGLAIGVGLEAISLVIKGEHFPSIWLWALLSATLRFIPYLGPVLGAGFPLVISIGWWPEFDMFLATAGYIIVIELISNNIMEPLLYGSSTGMSALAVIAAAAFWTFVWGPVGLLVATPLMTCLVVLGKYVPALRFLDILLGDEPVLPPHGRLYQRMLALDAEDAEDVAQAYRKDHPLSATFDDVLLPALAMAEHDRHSGNLAPDRSDFIRVTARQIVDLLSSQQEPLPSDSVDLTEPAPGIAAAPAARIAILPCADAADMTAALMLKSLLDRQRYESVVVSDEELASEKLESVFGERADIAVISAVPPRALTRARYLIKRLRQAQQQRGEPGSLLALIVGLWCLESDSRRAAAKLGDGGPEVRLVTRLGDALEEIRQAGELAAARRNAEETGSPRPGATHPANNSLAAR